MTVYYKRNEIGRIDPVNVLERLWLNSFGDTDETCWICTLKGAKSGHIRIRLDNKQRMQVHRLAYEAHHAEPIPAGLQVNHHCDNPACFNPSHLYLGTQFENMQDRLARTGYNLKRKLTKEQREYIKKSDESRQQLARRFNVTPQAIDYHRKKLDTGKGSKNHTKR